MILSTSCETFGLRSLLTWSGSNLNFCQCTVTLSLFFANYCTQNKNKLQFITYTTAENIQLQLSDLLTVKTVVHYNK